MDESWFPEIGDREFGIEIEAFGVPTGRLISELTAVGIMVVNPGYTHRTSTSWKIVSDSTIQGVNPFELVSPILRGREGFRQIQIVCEVLNRLGAQVNSSCGFHVHYNARDFSLDNFKDGHILYAKYETVMEFNEGIKIKDYFRAAGGANDESSGSLL